MVTRLALAAVSAMGLYVATLGIPTASRCDGIAGAAPSRSCSSDLRECLRLSAKTGIYGARYVTADDVAKCVDAFNECIHGGTGAGGATPSPTTSTGGGGRKGLPPHLGITYEGTLVNDCKVSGDKVSCKIINPNAPVGNQDSWIGEIKGTLSGMTMTGTQTIRVEGHYDGSPGCFYTEEASGPARYVFDSDGTVAMRNGPLQWQHTDYGSCSNSSSQTSAQTEGTARWSPLG
ncbi:hypothetical protein B1987_10415 [Mycobacterium kansasii]|uniref:Uncharacterized protein n=1 Tax=Mycobacterium attenuatum TaxID=2341086 RepID=A0A498QCM2_9MYCO|nr:hypothetical protein [Mycobacterium attenuatum]ORB84140.1 hypothetical protein B1987_10415 [Mycobacterium kansasii]VBA42709.1 hypothetical protein LAUMK136_04730 [Mycobacterium attenuatum]VBA58823.1 hypothetical protein LAUMK191_04722 [Mycobacterium attenuatum]